MTEDLDQLAGEFVLGTLPIGERRAFETRLPGDPEAQAAVRFWQGRFRALDEAVPSVRPDARLWAAIEAAMPAEAKPPQEPGADAVPDEAAGTATIVDLAALKRRLAVWRGAALASGAIAAALLVFVLIAPLKPARDAGDSASGRYVAVIDSAGREPALIAEVDTLTGTIRLRSLEAQTPQGRSLEIWHVDAGGAPRSLGILDASLGGQTMEAPSLRGAASGEIAVSVEPPGGSTSGAPTGPVVYTGRLVAVE